MPGELHRLVPYEESVRARARARPAASSVMTRVNSPPLGRWDPQGWWARTPLVQEAAQVHGLFMFQFGANSCGVGLATDLSQGALVCLKDRDQTPGGGGS